MKLASTAFGDKARIPAVHTRTGGQPDRSPELVWTGAPAGTRSFALLCIDPHPVARNWVHWIIFDIPPAAGGLKAGQPCTERLPDGSRQGRNGYGDIGWGGPQPPPGTGDHPYEFTLYALDADRLDVKATAPSVEEVRKSMPSHVLGQAALVGYYSQ
ncbi:MAG: YbhB/YbcL family Raf kinase inhibitor-like protein [Deltaproteobacteria bacterium]|nr:YbhB/YbcL family Raf kinase inhibitor-like protein [Deltaproteobacteria bacterium]